MGGGQCRQTLEGDVTIHVLGLGRIAEKIICSSLHDVYSGIPEIVERCAYSEINPFQPPSENLLLHPLLRCSLLPAALQRRGTLKPWILPKQDRLL